MNTILAAYKNAAAVLLPALVGLVLYAARAANVPLPLPLPPPVPPASATVAAGHAYGVVGLAGTYADAWDQAGTDVTAGKPMASVQTALQTSWQAARTAEGTKSISPILEAIIPGGSEGDTASRAAYAAAAHDLATGLRGVK